MTNPLIPPPRPDETFTVTDLNPAAPQVWSASRRGVTDADGVTWFVTAETGWNDSASVRVTSTDQPRGDGARLSQQWRTGRTVTLTGTAWIPRTIPERTIDVFRRAWLGLLADGPRAGTFDGTAADGTRQRLPLVVLTGQPRAGSVAASGWERRFAWQLTVTADDPLKYSVNDQPQTCGLPQPSGGLVYPLTYPLDYHTPTETGQVTMVNTGTATSWPRLLIPGPFDRPTVADPDTGNTLTVELTDPNTDDYLLIDTNPLSRRVLLNGVATRRAAVRVTGEWVPVPPGTTRLRYRAATYSTSRLTVSAPSASW